jgi:hypothetical protein
MPASPYFSVRIFTRDSRIYDPIVHSNKLTPNSASKQSDHSSNNRTISTALVEPDGFI